MSAKLSVCQRLLTLACNRLKKTIDDDDKLLLANSDGRRDNDFQRHVRKALLVTPAEANKVEEALYKLCETFEALSMDKDLPKQRKLDDAIRETEVLLGRTQETISNLMKLQVDIEQAAKQGAETEPQNAKLAPIPIPKFKGDIWEWDTFWTSFNYNVHSKNIDEYCKLHYLLEALQGEALQNRVREIRNIVEQFQSPVRFGYVDSSENPADCATRGLKREEFEEHSWWYGPQFITQPVDQWPEECNLFNLPPDNEGESTQVHKAQAEEVSDIIEWERYSRLSRIQNVIALVLRFFRAMLVKVSIELRDKVERNVPELRAVELHPYTTVAEREMAMRILIRNHQKLHLPAAKQNELKQLKIRNDENGILRCQGRLGNSELPRNARYPIVLASKTHLARLVIHEAHSPYHCGTSHTIAKVRERFWIPKIRQMTRTIIRQCVPCQKFNNLPYKYPVMDDLPDQRVRKTRPFEHVGIDYFGPLLTKQENEIKKVFGIILTCATTRLVHLELTTDMSTDQLLHALRRFIARRGVPASITSDNGPNLLLAEQILREAVLPIINDVSLAQSLSSKGIVWRTITPFAPWQGAFYERLIRSIKQSLYKVTMRTFPSLETIHTLLVEIEGCINSRPLTYQEEKWEATPALRPIDFVQRDIVVTFPFESIGTDEDDPAYHPQSEAVLLHTRQQAEKALKASHQLTEQFWKIWRSQYLTSLRESHKLQMDNKRGTNVLPAEGTVVLISEPMAPRNVWKLARIIKVNRSSNDIIREVELRLPSGRTIRRPINLLIPLELGNIDQRNEEEEKENEQIENQHRYELRPRIKKNTLSPATLDISYNNYFKTTEPPTTPSTIAWTIGSPTTSQQQSNAPGRIIQDP
ncbi:unnamed protein product [Nippostrongylus brasiliensis]|uniref:Integrase catalytic domain-containing protein n=1 Tax=Nippostrongylus brasiliensis TaxID=27835 RepID=A0A0N4YDI0_NIPBR|nr:unnamed protein product [Nippostrongylus brasiliensis]